jgi:uncharacterized protein (TIGR02117 family)
LYAAAAFGFSLWPSESGPASGEPTVQAYVLSNGVHTDIVLPLAGEGQRWMQLFPAASFPSVPADAAFVAIGWGDREFYLNTPRWSDLTAERALQALSGSGRSLAHVSFLRAQDVRRTSYRVPLTADQYTALTQYILSSLVVTKQRAVPVTGYHYGRNDAFFEARGSYNLFNTCNTWTGRGLRWAGVRISAWTPLETNVTWNLQPGSPEPASVPVPPAPPAAVASLRSTVP